MIPSWNTLRIAAVLTGVIVSAALCGCGGGGGKPPTTTEITDRSADETGKILCINNYDNWFNETSDPSQKDQMLQILAKRDNVCFTEHWTNVSPQALRAINPDIKVYRVYDLMCKNTWDPDWNDASNTVRMQTPITKAEIDEKDWWLRDSKGEIMKENPYIWYLDVGKPGYKEAFLKAVLERTNGKGYDGIVFDYWWPSLNWVIPAAGGVMPPRGYASDQEWFDKAWKPFIAYVCDGLHAAGYKVIGNCAGEYGNTTPSQEWQRTKIDGVVYEQWAVAWPYQNGDWLPGDVIEKRIRAMSTDPLEVWSTEYGLESSLPDYDQKQRVSLAMFYIATPGGSAKRSYYHIRDRRIYWSPLWDFYIGRPTQPAVKMYGEYFWSRKYTQGIVLMNYEAESSVSYPLDRTYRDDKGTLYSGTVTLPPHSALILAIANP